MAKYDISTFTWYDPEPRAREMAVSVSEPGGFKFDDQLRKKLPELFRLCASRDKRVLGIVEAEDDAVTLPKDGRKQLPKLLRDIEDAGVILPARYVFYAEDGMLFGELSCRHLQSLALISVNQFPRGHGASASLRRSISWRTCGPWLKTAYQGGRKCTSGRAFSWHNYSFF